MAINLKSTSDVGDGVKLLVYGKLGLGKPAFIKPCLTQWFYQLRRFAEY